MNKWKYVVTTDHTFMPHWYLTQNFEGYDLTEYFPRAIFFDTVQAGIEAIAKAGKIGGAGDLRVAEINIDPLW